jgi:hypothetical protein
VASDGFNRCHGVARWIAFRAETQLTVWVFLLSNLLWIIWGWHVRACALITLQVCLAVLNIRGAQKNDPEADPGNCST